MPCEFVITHESGRTVRTSADARMPPGRVVVVAEPLPRAKAGGHAELWDIRSSFDLRADGTFAKGGLTAGDAGDEAQFRVVPGASSSFRIEAFLSPLRAVTEEVRALTRIQRRGRVVQLWQKPIPPARDIHFIAPDVLAPDGRIDLERTASTPDTTEEVFALKRAGTPRLLAVSWPGGLRPKVATPKPVPFLVFYVPHETLIDVVLQPGQPPKIVRLPDLLGVDPFDGLTRGHVMTFVQFLRYRELRGRPLDPLGGTGRKGLPYQIERSRKDVVLVIPLPSGRDSENHGDFRKPVHVQRTLRELQALMLRILAHRAGVDVSALPGDVGRVALAGWSEGCTAVAQAVASGGLFVSRNVVEAYGFGPADEGHFEASTRKWRKLRGRAFRLYLDEPAAAHGFDVNTSRATTVRLGQNAWDAVKKGPVTAHSAIAAFMLTDALRRSKNF